mmetsp:Transcript_30956/g.70761  ORF Transcript_30956/g.70761 Transcript_30956/m.70761 type:complete len:331 (+) Transcript_30956:1744-2736(+)
MVLAVRQFVYPLHFLERDQRPVDILLGGLEPAYLHQDVRARHVLPADDRLLYLEGVLVRQYRVAGLPDPCVRRAQQVEDVALDHLAVAAALVGHEGRLEHGYRVRVPVLLGVERAKQVLGLGEGDVVLGQPELFYPHRLDEAGRGLVLVALVQVYPTDAVERESNVQVILAQLTPTGLQRRIERRQGLVVLAELEKRESDAVLGLRDRHVVDVAEDLPLHLERRVVRLEAVLEPPVLRLAVPDAVERLGDLGRLAVPPRRQTSHDEGVAVALEGLVAVAPPDVDGPDEAERAPDLAVVLRALEDLQALLVVHEGPRLLPEALVVERAHLD